MGGVIDASATPASPETPPNASFESPVPSGRLGLAVAPRGRAVAWRFGRSAGIAREDGAFARNNPTPAGSRVAFIRNRGHLRQVVSLRPGRAYAVSFLVAQRLLDDGTVDRQALQVRIGPRLIGDFTPASTADGRFVRFTSDAFTVPDARPRLLSINGTNRKRGEDTALVDQIVVTG
ncbi:hypothetical protein [Tautonia plasticadhaerens]|uniref:Uncharacterized protein n=1 Tax=Tautonia plasticadhaerens TaxID=2527974 RepID=A0A518HFA2_9BACT|nr:hypothetical protein [Tautonia plasticadhaerens]QDV39456.1 hypothetical protein ElP_74230 [Tautonia plasticadhaerens]